MRHQVIGVGSLSYFWRLHWRLRERLPMWIVYRPDKPPSAYPGLWVARMHVMLPAPKPTRFVITHPGLSDLREALPPGVVRMERHAEDAPEIVEMWL